MCDIDIVTILVLVDSVLQYLKGENMSYYDLGHNPCFSGQCFAIKSDVEALLMSPASQSLF